MAVMVPLLLPTLTICALLVVFIPIYTEKQCYATLRKSSICCRVISYSPMRIDVKYAHASCKNITQLRTTPVRSSKQPRVSSTPRGLRAMTFDGECRRCGRYGHKEAQCYAKMDTDGKTLPDKGVRAVTPGPTAISSRYSDGDRPARAPGVPYKQNPDAKKPNRKVDPSKPRRN